MTTRLEQIAHDLAALSRSERLVLLRTLSSLEQPPGHPGAEEAWDEEITARMRAIDVGAAESVAYEDLAREIQETAATFR